MPRAQRIGLPHALYSFIDLGTAAYVQFSQLDKRFPHQLKRLDISVIELDCHGGVLEHLLELFQLFETACSIVKVAWVRLVNAYRLAEGLDCLLELALFEELVAEIFQAQALLLDPGLVLPAKFSLQFDSSGLWVQFRGAHALLLGSATLDHFCCCCCGNFLSFFLD